jgi:predicted Fe-S protein YdhL (DUF1289 family)
VGICSTTYGDLVCRGCKRFAHEIVEWNAYEDAQRRIVWQRLTGLRDGAVEAFLSARQVAVLARRADELRVGGADRLSAPSRAYEVLRRLARFQPPGPSQVPDAAVTDTPRALLERIDREFYTRSVGVYEHSFKVSAQ